MEQSIENKLIKADKAFSEWKKTPFEDRQKLIAKAAEILKNNSEKFGTIITTEMNKPISQSIAEVGKCALMMNYYADAENILKPEKVDSEYSYSEIHYVPKGVILGVMPWNFPFWQVLRFAVPAILAGNTVVLKHASICFGSGNAIEEVLLEAGFPEGIFQNLEVGHNEVKEILEHEAVKGVSLTGSGRAGAEVASTAGLNMKKSLLELGGSDAFIVLDDADLDKAAKVGAQARLQNCGQTCVAAKRFIIDEKIEDVFLPKFIEEYKKFVPGNPMDKETKISGMARPDLANDLEKQFKKALENGAEIMIPLERISDHEFKPGLIRVYEGNPILQEELFGPLGMVMVAKNDEEALKMANDIPFGLSNSVWTNDKDRQLFFIENLESGTVNINRMTSSDPRFPFGGTKASGYGTELSLLALKEFVTAKTIVGN
ncbi:MULTISPECIES: aldehyde dehydrogenase family protein [Chryseobacterium]|uniref:Succinate-semialdehyde dehydrogenase/glutarate-semialdehyde dehydrogenase n=1 Tax=Chryseobacterium geocarposphaerae TaxID=1416776 RepID=A0ABU1LGY6_9FLAO|nr:MULTISPECIES: aldehyde dehydrogenase family protein [Chryseobacterium]MDR6405845.1 succinate-semialdehyde dehydrogenase/glutarate-semialdehyde dehydrogenase [Chryseobacterium geocarposphaerae]MDR6698991.1 succinate-semialdehyde dehydrogenase/glutarate-semialdehyde dehydrogenase [Chryseobacterium ginsenosidimutans]